MTALEEYATNVDRQRGEALLQANRVRLRRSAIKAQLGEAEITLEQVIDLRDPLLGGMLVLDLILALPAVGKRKGPEWLTHSPNIRRTTTLGALTERQERWLRSMARGHQRLATWRQRRARAVREGRVIA